MAQKVTIKDIAQAAGVSTTLVSFVMNGSRSGGKKYSINEQTAQRIMQEAERLHYRPNNAARSLRSGRSLTIGVVVPDISNKFFADIAHYIEAAAYQHGYTVLFGSTDENASKTTRIVDVFINKGIDGLIIAPCAGSTQIIKRLSAQGIPIVLLDRDIRQVAGLGRVMLDNSAAAQVAIRHLAANGLHRTECVSYDMLISNLREREEGYEVAMRATGAEEYIRLHRMPYGKAEQQMPQIITDAIERGTEALFFTSNTLALAGLKALNKLHLHTPDDIAVVGFDDSEVFDLYHTTITHVKQPTDLFGRNTVEMIISMIEAQPDSTPVLTQTLVPILVEGGSSRLNSATGKQ